MFPHEDCDWSVVAGHRDWRDRQSVRLVVCLAVWVESFRHPSHLVPNLQPLMIDPRMLGHAMPFPIGPHCRLPYQDPFLSLSSSSIPAEKTNHRPRVALMAWGLSVEALSATARYQPRPRFSVYLYKWGRSFLPQDLRSSKTQSVSHRVATGNVQPSSP